MAKQGSFTIDECNLLRLAPALDTGGMSAADPSGIFGSIKEAAAGASGMGEATQAHASPELCTSLDADCSIAGVPHRKLLLGEGSRFGGVRISDTEQAFITEVTKAAGKA